MNMQQPAPESGAEAFFLLFWSAQDLNQAVEDSVKEVLERTRVWDLTPVQAILLWRLRDHEVTAGELKSRGYYSKSNVSYSQKKLVDKGYMYQVRCEIDRRSVRVRATPKGKDIAQMVSAHVSALQAEFAKQDPEMVKKLTDVQEGMEAFERYLKEKIRYIY